MTAPKIIILLENSLIIVKIAELDWEILNILFKKDSCKLKCPNQQRLNSKH